MKIHYSSDDLGECINYWEFIENVIGLRFDLAIPVESGQKITINFDER